MIVPIMKLNFGCNFYYQEDNSPVHKSRLVKEFMNMSQINVLSWPAKSPDINIFEDVWRILSDMVDDGPQFNNKDELTKKLNESISSINSNRRCLMLNL